MERSEWSTLLPSAVEQKRKAKEWVEQENKESEKQEKGSGPVECTATVPFALNLWIACTEKLEKHQDQYK